MQDASDAFNCDSCPFGKHCDDSNPAPHPVWEIPGVIESNICLLPMVDERSWQLIRLYNQYDKNILPLSGGWLDQPNFYIEAIEIIGAERVKIQKEKAKKRGKSRN